MHSFRLPPLPLVQLSVESRLQALEERVEEHQVALYGAEGRGGLAEVLRDGFSEINATVAAALKQKREAGDTPLPSDRNGLDVQLRGRFPVKTVLMILSMLTAGGLGYGMREAVSKGESSATKERAWREHPGYRLQQTEENR